MPIVPAAAALLVLRTLRLGPLRLTPYGLCAALGLLLAMGLAHRTAARGRLNREAAWDAGLFAIASCFIASRLLLVLRDPVAFAHYPLLVLSLPSLTFGGMAVAAVMLWAYLRRKRLALLPLLDVYAAPAALLSALLELGHALDGSEVGMPTPLPWAVHDPWAVNAARVHPVALYGMVGALLLAAALWRTLARNHSRSGRVAAIALWAGGMLAFGLNLLTQPLLLPPALWLEPGQWIALAAIFAGGVLWLFAPMEQRAVRIDAHLESTPLEDSEGVPTVLNCTYEPHKELR